MNDPNYFHREILKNPFVFGKVPEDLLVNGDFYLDPIIVGGFYRERYELTGSCCSVHPVDWKRRNSVIWFLQSAIVNYSEWLLREELNEIDVDFLTVLLCSFRSTPFYDSLKEINLIMADTVGKIFPKIKLFLLEKTERVKELFFLCQVGNRWKEYYGYQLLLTMLQEQQLFNELAPLLPLLGDKLDRACLLDGNDCLTHLVKLKNGLQTVGRTVYPLFLGLGTEVPKIDHPVVVKLITDICQSYGSFEPNIKVRKSSGSDPKSFVYVNFLTKEAAAAAADGLNKKMIKDMGPLMAKISF
jgi:hypothetical protein